MIEWTRRLGRSLFATKMLSDAPVIAYDVVVHIGAPKTGTSAIQYFLLSNASLLADLGFYYPEHGFDRNRISGGHSGFGRLIIDKKREEARAWVVNEIEIAKVQGKTLLLSAESLFNYSDILSYVLEGYKTRIIALFRDPIDALFSNYHQAVKRHFAALPLKRFIQLSLGRTEGGISGSVFEKWVECFGSENVTVAPYDQDLFKIECIEIMFLKVIGLTTKQIAQFSYPEQRINSGYTPTALELKRLINNVLDVDDQKSNFEIDWCLQEYSDRSDESRPALIDLIDSELYEKLVQKYLPTNEYMRKTFLTDGLGDFLVHNKEEGSGADIRRGCRAYSLQYALAEVFKGREWLVDHIRQRLRVRLGQGAMSLELVKLADLLDIDIEEYHPFCNFLKPQQVDAICLDNRELPDVLVEIAVALERNHQFEDARRVISRALSLRPNGRAIVPIHDRLTKLCAKNGESG